MWAAVRMTDSAEGWVEGVSIHTDYDGAAARIVNWVKETWDEESWDMTFEDRFGDKDVGLILVEFFGENDCQFYKIIEIETGAPPLPAELDSDPIDMSAVECQVMYQALRYAPAGKIAIVIGIRGRQATDLISLMGKKLYPYK